MEQRSETSAHKIQTPGNHPKERIQNSGLTDWNALCILIISLFIPTRRLAVIACQFKPPHKYSYAWIKWRSILSFRRNRQVLSVSSQQLVDVLQLEFLTDAKTLSLNETNGASSTDQMRTLHRCLKFRQMVHQAPIKCGHYIDAWILQHVYVYMLTHIHVCVCVCIRPYIYYVYIYIYIQGVPGGMCQTSGECSLC